MLEHINLPQEGLNLRELIAAIEKKVITQALERTDQNSDKAAAILGLNRTTLVEKRRKYGFPMACWGGRKTAA